MALFGGGPSREQRLEQELAQAKRTIGALSNAGQFDSRLSANSNDRAEGYAAGLEAALKVVHQWRGNGLVIEEIDKAIRALDKEGP